MSHQRLCVIRPAFNEASLIGRTLGRVRTVLPNADIIVVDGGSTDGTVAIAIQSGAMVIDAPRGRGIQCHAGAIRATTEWLLFLHADTLLPLEAKDVFLAVSRRRTAIRAGGALPCSIHATAGDRTRVRKK